MRPVAALQGDGRTLVSGGRTRLRSGVVVVQISVAMVLVTCGSLMLRTWLNRMRVDLGFDPRGAIRADVSLPPDRYGDPVAKRTAVDRLLDASRRTGGVTAVGASTWALPTGAGGQRSVLVAGREDRMLPASARRG